MLKEFKAFIMRGNVVELAVGVVIGSAFTSIVTNIVKGLITPLVAWIVSLFTRGKSLNEAMSVLDWSPAAGVTFAFGDVVSAAITFLITGVVLFLIVKALNKFQKPAAEETPEPSATEEYLADIRDLLVEQNTANFKKENWRTTIATDKGGPSEN